MENITKFAATSEASCKRDTLAMSCVSSVAGASGVGGAGGVSVTTPNVSTHTSTWLAALHVNNNNNSEKSFSDKDLHRCHINPLKGTNTLNSADWKCDSCDTYQKNGTSSNMATIPRVALNEEDEGGGKTISELPLTYSCSASAPSDVDKSSLAASFLQAETDFDAYDMCGAVSLSPPLLEDHFAMSAVLGAGCGVGSHSNRTSLNNSTENLSYISDNFYGDDLILLEDDVDVEAEELSLNSDDCIYAYRGEGADFDLPLPPLAGLGSNFVSQQGNNQADEETDFLEMDFEPDPLSELEYNQTQTALNYPQNLRSCSEDAKEQYLLQRDACHLATPTQRHQLFSSPIDDLPPPSKALQAQSMLSKNFARITLHLDQIQKDYNEDLSDEGRGRLNSALDTRPLEEEFVKDVLNADTSHSLPNTLHEHFTNRCNSESAVVASAKDSSFAAPLQTLTKKSPSKITGAKPKRLSTFSSTSSTSSKNSSKSRNSLRSAFQTTTLGTNSSFDERSVSCSEFRTERDLTSLNIINTSKQPLLTAAPHNASSTVASLKPEFNNITDETCLDCLEKEFLANTIGKALDPQGCFKCRKRLGHLSLYANRSTDYSKSYRRSASPTTTFFFNDQPSSTSRLFSCEFLNSQARKRQEWDSYMQENKEIPLTTTGKAKSQSNGEDVNVLNQSLKNLESKLLTNVKPPDPCTVTVPTVNLTETCLVQALDKLQISYNHELLQTSFNKFNNNYFKSSLSDISHNSKEFQNLKDFLIYVSKSQGNHFKLKRIINKVTQNNIIVQFKKDPSITDVEMVTVRVSDILHYWSHCKNLEILKEMDKHFEDSNILGKIGNLIRQAHQRTSCSSRRLLPEFISIPQYYPSGFLTLTKKC